MVKDVKSGQWHVYFSLKLLEIEQEHPQFVIQISDNTFSWYLQPKYPNINDEIDRIIGEINRQSIKSVRVGLDVNLYRYNYSCL